MSKDYWDSLAPSFEQSVMQIAEHDLDSTLKNQIRRVAKGRRLAADLGCGVGSLLPLLCQSFSKVYAVDFSSALLQEAKNRLKHPNVHFVQHNLAGDRRLPWTADVTFCVNALITARPSHRKKIGLSVFKATKKAGLSVIVVPSLESVFHTYHTIVRCNVKDGYKRHHAMRSVNRLFKTEVVSPADGIVNIGDSPTKCFMREEITTFLSDIGFEVAKIQRVQYPWHEEMTNAPSWLKAPYPWDWLVLARRPK
ncbi:MAG: class I SAM-dependent methyltransferase [Planctomycetes bacterium]|nr:class I SAM-dependent methyltransferase [Planctomycetota bacterium]